MNYISDVMYFADVLPKPSDGVQDIVKDFSPLTKGQDDFLNGSVVEMIIPDNSSGAKQLVYNSSGGKFNAGQLNVQKYDLSRPTNTKFLMEWAGNGGYYLWPMNGDKTIQLFMDVDDGKINGSNGGQGIPGKYELTQRVYKLSNIATKDGNLYVNLSVASKFGNFPIGIDGTIARGGSGLSPVNIWLKFITLGTKAWEMLMKSDTSVSSRCCFPNNIMTGYDNFNTACNNTGFTVGSPNCNGVVPKACSSFIKNGYEDPFCKDWCTSNPKECYTSIKEWCNDSTKNNLNKGVCSCFNDGKFQTFQKEFTKNCKSPCKISDFTAGCFYPPCLQSGMNKVANQGETCPSNTSIFQSCVQTLTSQMGGNVSADKIVALCQLNAGEADIPDPVKNGDKPPVGTGTVAPPVGTGTVAPPVGTGTIAPPVQDNSMSSFWDKNKLYIIIGIVVLVLLVIVAIFVSMKK
jgi:hypothetical protein